MGSSKSRSTKPLQNSSTSMSRNIYYIIKFPFRNKACESKSSTSPELVARYCDSLLRKSNRTLDEAAMDERFNQIMIVFKYIDDKDIFQKFYTKFFANRLIKDTYASEDAEENMINKLKGKNEKFWKEVNTIYSDICGYEYTSKLHRMFQDISISKNLNKEYKTKCDENSNHPPIDLRYGVLTRVSRLDKCPFQRKIAYNGILAI